MSERSVEVAVETQRARVLELEDRLARRRATEAAELELLEGRTAEVERRTTAATRALETSKTETTALAMREETLKKGLSEARRTWARVVEPALGGLALLFAFVVIGLEFRDQRSAIAFEVGGFLLGLVLAHAWRLWRRR